jgi:hypothetical protein
MRVPPQDQVVYNVRLHDLRARSSASEAREDDGGAAQNSPASGKGRSKLSETPWLEPLPMAVVILASSINCALMMATRNQCRIMFLSLAE